MIGLRRFCIFLMETSGALPTQYILDSCFDWEGCACPASTSQRKWLLSRLETPKHPNQLSAFSYPQCQGPWCGSTACKDLYKVLAPAHAKTHAFLALIPSPKVGHVTRILRIFKESTVVPAQEIMEWLQINQRYSKLPRQNLPEILH